MGVVAAVILAFFLVGYIEAGGPSKLAKPFLEESAQKLTTPKDGKVSVNMKYMYTAGGVVTLTCQLGNTGDVSKVAKYIILKDGTEVSNSASVKTLDVKTSDWKASAVYTCKLKATEGLAIDSDLSNEMVLLTWGPAIDVSSLKVTKITKTGADVTWSPPTDTGFTKYIITVVPSGAKASEVKPDATKPTAALSDLKEDTVYAVSVKTAYTVGGFTMLGKEESIWFITAGAGRLGHAAFALVLAALLINFNY